MADVFELRGEGSREVGQGHMEHTRECKVYKAHMTHMYKTDDPPPPPPPPHIPRLRQVVVGTTLHPPPPGGRAEDNFVSSWGLV